jgi:uncharacterized membrane protein YphA (DoxX/SURF4 family)
VTGFLTLVFLASGGVKLLPRSPAEDAFTEWGFPAWFRYFVGACEVAGGVGLLIPRLAPLAAVGLVLLMGGAAATHLKTPDQAAQAAVPIALIALLVPLAWVRFRGRKSA